MQQFTNEVIEIDLLPKYEDVNLRAPHQDYWKVIVINIFIFFGIVALALLTLIFFVSETRPFIIHGAAIYMVISLFTFYIYRASFKKRGYALREKDIMFKSGIIAETTSIIPLNRIQHVALAEGMFSRIYKLATLQIHTAGSSLGHMHIAGIPVDDAKMIKEALLKKLDSFENTAN